MTDTTLRKCDHSNCGQPGTRVKGHYMVGPRTVRVWVCSIHYMMVVNPLQVLPTPASIVAALRAEQDEYNRAAERQRREEIDLDGRSVKTLASSGHGNPIKGDRVAAWRWGA